MLERAALTRSNPGQQSARETRVEVRQGGIGDGFHVRRRLAAICEQLTHLIVRQVTVTVTTADVRALMDTSVASEARLHHACAGP